MKYPLIPVTLLLVAGIVLGEWLPSAPVVVLAASFLAAMAALVSCLLNSRRICLAALALAWLLAGWSDMACHTAVVSPNDLRRLLPSEPAEVMVCGFICAAPAGQIFERDGTTISHVTLKIDVDRVLLTNTWRPAFGKIIARATGDLPPVFFTGQEIEVAGVIGLPRRALAQGLFDARQYYRRQGIYFELQAGAPEDLKIIAKDGSANTPLSERFSAWAKKTLSMGIPVEDDPLRLIWTLVLDWREPLTPDVEEPFMRAGTYHIFAVDGLRIGLLAAIGIALLRALQVGRALAGLIVLPAVWWYVALTGWPASAVRAAIMTSVVIAGWAIKRPGNLVNSLFAAALIILIWDPRQLFQAGFQLSFLVVLCIALLVPPIRNTLDANPAARFSPQAPQPAWRRSLRLVRRFAVDTIAVSLGAWLGSIPLGACYFHLFTPMSVPANFVVVPLTSLALMSSLGSLLVAPVCPWLSDLFNCSSWLWMKWIIAASEWFARLPTAYWNMASPRPIGFAWYYLVLLTVCTGWVFRSRFKWAVFGLIAALSVAWCADWQIQKSMARIDVLSLRQAPAVFVRPFRDAGELLLDCGDPASAERITTPFLRAQGVNRLDNFCLTVARAAAMAGAEVVWTNFSPRNLFTGAAPARSGVYNKFFAQLASGRSAETALKDGGQADGWSVLAPATALRLRRADDNAVVLWKSLNGTSVLLLSSLGRSGQDALAQRHPELRADIVVAGLPAMDEPLSEPLLDLVQPKLLVIGDSEFTANAQGSSKLKERLARRGIRVVYCHEAGAVTLVLKRGRWEIEDVVWQAVSEAIQR